MSFVESREIFDLFLKDFPAFAFYIGKDALIVENKLFEKLSDENRLQLAPL
jgi:hypothetical protein